MVASVGFEAMEFSFFSTTTPLLPTLPFLSFSLLFFVEEEVRKGGVRFYFSLSPSSLFSPFPGQTFGTNRLPKKYASVHNSVWSCRLLPSRISVVFIDILTALFPHTLSLHLPHLYSVYHSTPLSDCSCYFNRNFWQGDANPFCATNYYISVSG